MASPRAYDVVTFDCYGTLIDWEGGLATAIMRAAWADGVRLERPAIIRAYMAAEREVEAGAYRSYREVLADSARGVATRLGWRLDPARASFLADSVPSWVAFPDTNASLERLRGAGYALGILSNIDDELLTATRRHFTVAFDLIVTAQQVRAYKPARPHFDAARQGIGSRSWLHVGQGYFHDMVPARAQGIPHAWINRNGEAPSDGGRTDREFPTLAELADWLAPAR
jgi:2-haloacid dehalogenase/putative hydrolase of the HAD superfamily